MSRISQTHPDSASISAYFDPQPTTSLLSSNGVDNGCTFNIPSFTLVKKIYQYDLCPLLSSNPVKIQVVADEDTPPTHTRYVYDIAKLGTDGLEWDGTLPSSLQCPKGTWMCLTVINTRPDHPSEPSRILQVIPISTVENIKPKTKYISDSQLQVAFHGGRYNGKKHKAVVQFHCDDNVKTSTPELLWSFNGTHTFSWASKHACPTILPISSTPATPTAPSSPDNEPPDSPPQEAEDPDFPDMEPHNNNPRTTRMLVGIFFVVFLVICLRRRKLRIMLFYSKVSRLLQMHGSNHQPYGSGGEITEDHLSSASISLEELSEGGHHERALLSPKDTTFPTYGL